MFSTAPLKSLLRLIFTALHNGLKSTWFVMRPRSFGVHAVALTPAGRIILVKQRYAWGWRLPGGGRKKNERPEAAIVRELQEEIGMLTYGDVERAYDVEQGADFNQDLPPLLIVRNVQYQPPSWSWEIEDVLETALDQLPLDLSPRTAKWLRSVGPSL